MSSLSRELVFLILQFLDEEKFKETVHKLEQESGFFFSMKYFEEQVIAGEWDEVERYLSGFTKVEDNRYSMKIFFEIRKQKYLEALDRQDRAKAAEILVKDLKIFASFNEELFKEITHLLTLDNFRQNEQLSKYGDTKSARNIMLMELKKLIEANPLFRDKLTLPSFKSSRLRTLINQSLNWQHQLCKNPRSNPDIKTLFVDHSCAASNGARPAPPTNSPLGGALPKAGMFHPLGVQSPFQPVGAPAPGAISGWLSNNSPLPHAAMAPGPPSLMQSPGAGAFLKHHRTPAAIPGMDYQSAESDQLMKRIRMTQPDEVSVSGVAHMSNSYSADDLPKTVIRALNQGSNVMSMDFHPQQQTILLVGTNMGEISLWEVGTRERIAHKPFKVWDLATCSKTFQTALLSDAAVAVNRCVWGPDGLILGVAFSKHLAQIYSYSLTGDLRQHLEIDAHVGGVNDIAFAHPNKQLCFVTCGDDNIIKVWDAVSGRRMYTFEGHEAPVYSICPHYKENIQFIFSTAVDGKIKAWLYDCLGSRVDYDAPGKWCTMMQYSADGTRLFSCGTSREGESHLVEWNESEGAVKRTYSGFKKRSLGVVQFDTTRNRFLAAGDEFQIKFWDMDNTNMLTVIDADGGLPASPILRFNKDGSMLAVTTSDNVIKILANGEGMSLIKMMERRSNNGNRGLTEALNSKPVISSGLGPVSSAAITMERADRIKPTASISNMATIDGSRNVDAAEKKIGWKLAEVLDSSQLNALKLPDPMATSKVVRLIYTNSGLSLLALASNAVHKLWKWPRSDRNPSDKSTASVAPQLWQPANGIPMTNDVNQTTSAEESAACMALSKNDSYVMSASGGKVSLFNMTSFKVMTTFMPPPPAATYLAFHPKDNNIIAVGMEDSSIHIYNVRIDEVGVKLKGHQKRITGLAFSQSLNTLVSSGADAQLCVWSIDQWEKKKTRFIVPQAGRSVPLTGETKVQYHNDQTNLLVVHESQISIYDSNLECVRSWFPKDSLQASISSAVYSCDGLLVYAAFCDGAVGIFDADSSLRLRCRIAPSAYIPSPVSGSVYPLVIASHPSDPNQIALGMSNGAVHVIEPAEAEPKRGGSQSQENGSRPSSSSNPALSGQPSEHPSR
uniref:CTLH domain-containing protein n=1 Tax=Kalanchoe fedtschenkoi TaxID=63787 RepID=A0A7N0U966_KALFE